MDRIALVTSGAQPMLSDDDRLLLPHLTALGIEGVPARWDDLTVSWGDFDAVILRSTWDYHRRIIEFDEWLEHLAGSGARVFNPLSALRWNSDKRYLLDLQKRGVPIVPTALINRDRIVDLGHVLRSNGWGRAVVKPSVGTQGYQTWLTEPTTAERDQRQLVAMMMQGDVIVQPFLNEIARDGEYSFVYFDGVYSHCFRRRPKAGDYRTQAEYGAQSNPVRPTEDMLAQAEAMLDALPHMMLYARVDVVLRDGKLLMMALELIEPGLGLRHGIDAPRRFAASIAMALRRQLSSAQRVGIDAPRASD
jgi:glutathione synthase/RimK-type ligase-like ATP-grasp enzyme